MPNTLLVKISSQQEIAIAFDATVRKYHVETPADQVSGSRVAAAMRNSMKDSIDRLYNKL